MEGLTEGRIVHYVLADGANKGKVRPAIVVDAWPDAHPKLREDGYCTLLVFASSADKLGQMFWTGAVTYSDKNEPGTWHWIPRV